jgi:hypothetical protein
MPKEIVAVSQPELRITALQNSESGGIYVEIQNYVANPSM